MVENYFNEDKKLEDEEDTHENEEVKLNKLSVQLERLKIEPKISRTDSNSMLS